MHPNVFMELSSELQVMCHLSKVQLRNFWTWIPMILRIFFGNKGTVLPFSYWICCFCRFQSAPDFLRSWAFTATCLASACTLPRRFVSCWLQIGSAWGFQRNLWLLFFELLQFFFLTDLDMYANPLGRVSRTSFFALQQVYSVYCNFLCTHLKHWRLRGRKSKKAWYISALSW